MHIAGDRIKDFALHEIDQILRESGKSLSDYPPMPIPTSAHVDITSNSLLMEELSYNVDDLLAQKDGLINSLTTQQKHIFDTIMDACYSGGGGFFFVNGFGGTGKTFLWNTLTTAIRSKGDIVLAGT